MSLTYIGAVVMGLAWLAKVAGIEVGSEQLTQSVEGIVFLVSFLITLYGRYRAGGIKWFGSRAI